MKIRAIPFYGVIKQWTEYHWFRLNENGPAIPPVLFSFPLVLFFLFMENLLKFSNAFYFHLPGNFPTWSRRKKIIVYGGIILVSLWGLKLIYWLYT